MFGVKISENMLLIYTVSCLQPDLFRGFGGEQHIFRGWFISKAHTSNLNLQATLN
jgi:hypothetical protein